MNSTRVNRAAVRLLTLLSLIGVASGLGCDPSALSATRIDLTVLYGEIADVDQVQLTLFADGEVTRMGTFPEEPTPATGDQTTIRILLPTDVLTADLDLRVDGLSAGAVVGSAIENDIDVIPGDRTAIEVTLGGPAIPGDGIIRADIEACDDGNLTAGDGCSEFQQIEEGFACEGEPSVCDGVCGDDLVRGSEACDDGNDDDDDGCSPSCTLEEGWACEGEPSDCDGLCGDGRALGDEACDDGNNDPLDGCDESCREESGWACFGLPSTCLTICGDGLVRGEETCDDGNNMGGDGCSASCRVADGFACNDEPSVCGPDCGDGTIVTGEACDDGNETVGDGCDSTCQLESGYLCAGVPSVCKQCGNGRKEADEGCDDGNTDAGDGCSATCTQELGYDCVDSAGATTCTAICGDGYVRGEACDDGNLDGGDGCSSTCTVENGFTCDPETEPSDCIGACGDGVRSGNEGCDDGSDVAGDGCSALCTVELGWMCPAMGACFPICGNRSVNGPETCDDGNPFPGDGCDGNCVAEEGFDCPLEGGACTPVCGDGLVRGAEQCDDGVADTADGGVIDGGAPVDGDGCDSFCEVESGDDWTCAGEPSVCQRCGDGVLQGTETCDLGAGGGMGCDASCQAESGYVCYQPLGDDQPSTCLNTCGNGVQDVGEGCDDDNNDPGDGCSPSCVVETGFLCNGFGADTCDPECGDGLVVTGEGCDDGNTGTGDGCDDSCQAEPGFTCNGAPSICANCGDGLLQGAESCDDGDAIDDNGCQNDCTIASGWACNTAVEPSQCASPCGDGVIAVGIESCDDSNLDNSDGCSSVCQVEAGWDCGTAEPSACTSTCGDGIKVSGEGCDDGNTLIGDGCDDQCVIEPGWSCPGNPSVCLETCGDLTVVGRETCDDGDQSPDDGCSAQCRTELGFTCPDMGGDCAANCGDTLVRGAEQCDDGDLSGQDGCSGLCQTEMGWLCDDQEPSVCATVCGDGLRLGMEVCDDNNLQLDDGCDDVCQEEPGWTCDGASPTVCQRCGNGQLEGTEACDDANTDPGDGCSAMCAVEAVDGWSCNGASPTVCQKCGNGEVEGTEGCDDGNATGADGCNAACAVELDWDCVGTAPSVCNRCGDGELQGFENCDDLNTAIGDGCNDVCQPEAGYVCEGEPSMCTEQIVCGNSAIEAPEQCDDGNTVGGDYCSADCSMVTGACGDGTKQDNEACDDGNTMPGDYCSADCKTVSGSCGDGAVQASLEACDDGNAVDDDNGCDATCQRNDTCGDGFVQSLFEGCDDMNLALEDGCDDTCQEELGYVCAGEPSVCECPDCDRPTVLTLTTDPTHDRCEQAVVVLDTGVYAPTGTGELSCVAVHQGLGGISGFEGLGLGGWTTNDAENVSVRDFPNGFLMCTNGDGFVRLRAADPPPYIQRSGVDATGMTDVTLEAEIAFRGNVNAGDDVEVTACCGDGCDPTTVVGTVENGAGNGENTCRLEQLPLGALADGCDDLTVRLTFLGTVTNTYAGVDDLRLLATPSLTAIAALTGTTFETRLTSCAYGAVDVTCEVDDGVNPIIEGSVDVIYPDPASCGDGVVKPWEACDDGNGTDGDYCSSDCQAITGMCGDGVAQVNEVCDGDDHGGATCLSLGYLPGMGAGLSECAGACDTFDVIDCGLPVDVAGIQAAIDAAAALPGHDVIGIPSDTYNLVTSLVIDECDGGCTAPADGVTLQPLGGTVTIEASFLGAAPAIQIVSGNNTLRGLRITEGQPAIALDGTEGSYGGQNLLEELDLVNLAFTPDPIVSIGSPSNLLQRSRLTFDVGGGPVTSRAVFIDGADTIVSEVAILGRFFPAIDVTATGGEGVLQLDHLTVVASSVGTAGDGVVLDSTDALCARNNIMVGLGDAWTTAAQTNLGDATACDDVLSGTNTVFDAANDCAGQCMALCPGPLCDVATDPVLDADLCLSSGSPAIDTALDIGLDRRPAHDLLLYSGDGFDPGAWESGVTVRYGGQELTCP